MKILNGTVAENPLAHVYELSDYLVISGSVYNKNPIYPLPLKFGLLEDNNSSVYFKEIYDVTDSAVIRYRNNKNTYVADKSDYKIHYTFYNNLGMYKMVDSDDGLEITRFEFTPTESNYSIEYSMQTDKYVVFIVQYSATSDVYIVNKSDLSVLNTKSYAYYLSTLGFYYDKYDDKYYIHLFSRTSLSNGAFCCYSVELESLTETIVKSSSASATTYYYYYVPDIIRQSDDKSYFTSGTSNAHLILYSYKITGASSATIITNSCGSSTYNIAGIKQYIFNPEANYLAHVSIYSDNNVEISTNTLYIDLFSLSTESLDFNNDWSLTNSYSTSKSVILSSEHQTYKYTVCGRIKDDKTIFFANNEKISIYKWDAENKTYVLHNDFFDSIERIGIDANNNVWIRNSNKDLYTLDIEYSDYEVVLSADETDFDYVNSDINTSIKVRAVDRNNNDVRCHVILKISGAAKFTENNSQVIEIDLIGEEMEIPVTIFDQGIINIVYLN